MHCKDTNLKAIHNVGHDFLFRALFVHCKDTNLKAIHNFNDNIFDILEVVRALQRY